MEDFEVKLHKAISICNGEFMYLKQFSRIYSFATENVFGYLKYFDLQDKSLLTVGSSGDQVLNAYFKGCRDITLIDVNEFAKFYLYLKIGAIMSLSYTEFKEFFFLHGISTYYNKELFSKRLFNKIKPTLRSIDYESYLFFDELFTLYDSKDIKENLMKYDEVRNKAICEFNIYLKSRNTYYKLRELLIKKLYNFTYINQDIYEFDSQEKYDNIFLSNLACYTNLDNFKILLQKLDKYNLKDEGKMLISYLWNIKFDAKTYEDEWAEIYKMPIVREKIKEYIYEYHYVKDGKSIVFGNNQKKDLVLIYKKTRI